YTMLRLEGKSVTALSAMPPDMQAQGIPPFWTSYVKHSDVDTVVEKMVAAGGTVMFPPMDAMEYGRMTMGQDPTGAAFGVWQPGTHIGAQLVNIPNTLVWNELQTRQPDEAKAFYNTVFGWTGEADENGYVVYEQNGRQHAGMMAMDENWPPEVLNSWSTYFMVEDVAAKVATAQGLGGNVLVPPTPAGEIGIFSVLQDPQGGAFTIITFSGPVDSPPGY
ncbi:MAG: VOC family protein, partial [Chloroflexi bacterium]|nr:VOC family protein [Chloroflexota bacterium]